MTYHCSKQTVKAGCVGFDGSPLRVAKSGAAAGARLTEGPGTPPLRPRRSSLRRAALPGAGGRRLPHPGLRSSDEPPLVETEDPYDSIIGREWAKIPLPPDIECLLTAAVDWRPAAPKTEKAQQD